MVVQRVPTPRHFAHGVQCLQLFVGRVVGLACMALKMVGLAFFVVGPAFMALINSNFIAFITFN
jgi:hypothetical protein